MVPVDEFDEGKAKLTALVLSMDPKTECVIPSVSSGGSFRVGLSKANIKKYLSLSEDDLLDLCEDPAAAGRIRALVEPLIKELNP